jgi:SWI/SNF-related matrix-associated actin-dependent regulator of chromatin subfamily A3
MVKRKRNANETIFLSRLSVFPFILCLASKLLTAMVDNFDSNKFADTAWNEKELVDLVEMYEPSGLLVPPLPYQKQGLGWMVSSEEPELPVKPKDCIQFWSVKQEGGQTVYINGASNFSTTTKLTLFKGGILADDMGLEKTIQTLSLILHDINKNKASGKIGSTLVVCPVTLIGNWTGQIDSHFADGVITYQVIHGTDKESKIKSIGDFDISFTTYGNCLFPW